jgi:kynureninase
MPIDFAATKALFHLPEGTVYLDGNSLGPMVKTAPARMERAMQAEWAKLLIRGWNKAGWMTQPATLGDRIARLIGAAPGTVILGDTLSIKVYQALASALELNPRRRVILSDTGNFPSDLYIAEGLCRTLGGQYRLKTVAPEEVMSAIDDTVAVTLITEVDYRTGRRHDMTDITRRAHEMGALSIWDLAHSAGAIPVDLTAAKADFAVGCTYKYLNSGPGGPAFIYVAPSYADTVRPALSGWLGHDAPFAFEPNYRPGRGIERMRVGTPPVLQMAALEAALEVWEGINLTELHQQSLRLQDQFIKGVETRAPKLQLATPRSHLMRGSQVSFRHPEGYAIMQALIAEGVIGDFRAPDILRFGFTPLYIDEDDVAQAVSTLARIMDYGTWDKPEFKQRASVT